MRRALSSRLLSFFALGFVCFLVKRTRLLAREDERVAVQTIQLASEHPDMARRRALLAQAALDEGLAAQDPVVRERLRALFPEQPEELSESRLHEQARALNLFQRDPLLRMRLSVLKELSVSGAARSQPLDDLALQRFYETNLERYMRPTRVSFRQVFISRDKHGEHAEAKARAIRTVLMQSSAQHDLRAQGDPINLPLVVKEQSLREVRSRFGDAVAGAVVALPLHQWSEPVPSAWGYHLLWLTGRTVEQAHPLEAVRARAAADQRAALQSRMLEAQVAQLSARYSVELAQ